MFQRIVKYFGKLSGLGCDDDCFLLMLFDSVISRDWYKSQ